jgi:AbrB family looped-hinge helix DNA binding protein
MKTTHETDTIRFTVKGQIVIPRWLRNKFEIDEGTRAQVYAEGDHIILKPITPKYLKTLRGSLKGAGVLKALMDDRKREREL